MSVEIARIDPFQSGFCINKYEAVEFLFFTEP